jgi:hypothetical protein
VFIARTVPSFLLGFLFELVVIWKLVNMIWKFPCIRWLFVNLPLQFPPFTGLGSTGEFIKTTGVTFNFVTVPTQIVKFVTKGEYLVLVNLFLVLWKVR